MLFTSVVLATSQPTVVVLCTGLKGQENIIKTFYLLANSKTTYQIPAYESQNHFESLVENVSPVIQGLVTLVKEGRL